LPSVTDWDDGAGRVVSRLPSFPLLTYQYLLMYHAIHGHDHRDADQQRPDRPTLPRAVGRNALADRGHTPAGRVLCVRSPGIRRRGAVPALLSSQGPAGGRTGERPKAGSLELLLPASGGARGAGDLSRGAEAGRSVR